MRIFKKTEMRGWRIGHILNAVSCANLALFFCVNTDNGTVRGIDEDEKDNS